MKMKILAFSLAALVLVFSPIGFAQVPCEGRPEPECLGIGITFCDMVQGREAIVKEQCSWYYGECKVTGYTKDFCDGTRVCEYVAPDSTPTCVLHARNVLYASSDKEGSELTGATPPKNSSSNAVIGGGLVVLLVIAGYAAAASGKPTERWKQRHAKHAHVKRK